MENGGAHQICKVVRRFMLSFLLSPSLFVWVSSPIYPTSASCGVQLFQMGLPMSKGNIARALGMVLVVQCRRWSGDDSRLWWVKGVLVLFGVVRKFGGWPRSRIWDPGQTAVKPPD
ncbi:hypothetical protein M0R45_019204 [Rubus argutus]|uniref:Uncharacterized protein n=1 Tax=Rubus argutus TaxID=59490 RepID=A0AAW1X8E5_RUBAR